MATGYSAISEELQRLKAAGTNHVFLHDSTNAKIVESSQRQQASLEKTHSNDSTVVGELPKAEIKVNVSAGAKTSNNLPENYRPIPKEPPSIELPDSSPSDQLEQLKKQIFKCEVCNAHLSEFGKIVFGSGAVDADIFFCGEAPGADEEISGEPFVGKAGELLSKIIQAMGLKRKEVYIANILKWRPEHDKPYGNRPPTPEEMEFCLPYLKAQLQIIQPKVIVALGNSAVSGLLGHDSKRKLGAIRGQWHDFSGLPLMVTFHPSYLLRNDTMKTKRMFWEDMLKVMKSVELPVSAKQEAYFLPKQNG